MTPPDWFRDTLAYVVLMWLLALCVPGARMAWAMVQRWKEIGDE